MITLTVTANRNVTLSQELLRHLGVRRGEKIAVKKLRGRRIEIKAARPPGRISDVFGLLKRKNGPSLSIEEIGGIAKRS